MLQIRLLGELRVSRDGRSLELPASKKSRALLGYLVATGKPHLRETLCELLWPGPEDPRAALRWSLTKLRPLVDSPKRSRLVGDRERIAFDAAGTEVDLVRIRKEIGTDVESGSTEVLRAAASCFDGELLQGLDLPDCYRYHEWCTAQRELARSLRTRILATLVERLAGSPEEALLYARMRVTVDPLVEAAHVDVVRILTALGRRREALHQFETCRRLIANELGAKPSPALLSARMTLGEPDAVQPGTHPDGTHRRLPEPASPSLVGRKAETEAIRATIHEAVEGRSSTMILFSGEPGIGKTRLLEEVGRGVRSAGGTLLAGRAYEAEMVRPYGVWIDALRSAGHVTLPPSLGADLATLLPEFGSLPDVAGDRNRLFDAVARLLTHFAAPDRLVAVLLDDIQWFDDASGALLHFVMRAMGPSRILVACAARPRELSENIAVARLLRTLSREGRVHELRLSPLDAEATSSLVRTMSPGVDAREVFAESAGNPLFAVEMARALGRGESSLTESLASLIEDRLARLEEGSRDLLPWAAALGHGFTIGMLERVTRLPPTQLLRAVAELEERNILRASLSADSYDFVHDLIRAAAYRSLSAPRRRLLHGQIARSLDAAGETDTSQAGEIAHHAALGGDPALAARASVDAAEACLRVFANDEAVRIADAGMQYAERLDRQVRIKTQLRLMRVLVLSGRWKARRRVLGEQAFRLSSEARGDGLFAEAAQGFHTLSVLQHDVGDFEGAHASTLLAEAAGRSADPLTCARQLSKSAQCLAYIDRDMERATTMANEAKALAIQAGNPDLLYLDWADGLLRAYSGDYQASFLSFERALVLARREQEHWAEFECMARLIMLELEHGEHARALARCADLTAVAAKMGEGSEGPVSEALEAYARCGAGGDAAAEQRLERALAVLREVDVKGMLAHLLILAAELDLDRGLPDRAESRALEALGAAEALKRRSVVTLARAVLARVALARGVPEQARAHVRLVESDMRRPLGVSARARGEMSRVTAALAGAVRQSPKC